MAIGTPVVRYVGNRAAFNGTAQSFSPTTNLTAGTVAVLVVGSEASSIVVSSVTDSKGNVWTVDHSYTDAGLTCISGQIATSVTTTDTITINYSATGNLFRDFALIEVPGLSPTPFDVVAESSGSNGSLSAGPTSALSQADEIVFGIWQPAAFPTSVTPGAGYTSAGLTTSSKLVVEYQVVSATTAVTPTATLTGFSSTWIGLAATYKGAAADGGATSGSASGGVNFPTALLINP